jgi:hypothetical protein
MQVHKRDARRSSRKTWQSFRQACQPWKNIRFWKYTTQGELAACPDSQPGGTTDRVMKAVRVQASGKTRVKELTMGRRWRLKSWMWVTCIGFPARTWRDYEDYTVLLISQSFFLCISLHTVKEQSCRQSVFPLCPKGTSWWRSSTDGAVSQVCPLRRARVTVSGTRKHVSVNTAVFWYTDSSNCGYKIIALSYTVAVII